MSGFRGLSVFPDVVQLLSVSKEEVSPEQHDGSSSLKQEISEPLHIKEEPEELWSSQEGEQSHEPVPVKSKEDEEKPQSSQIYHRQTEEMETEVDGEDCKPETGGARYFDPERDLHQETEVKLEDLSDPESDDSADWREMTEHQSGLKSVGRRTRKRAKTEKKSQICTESTRIHTVEKPFGCSICGKSFDSKIILTNHMVIHNNEKLFSCSMCGCSFTQKGSLTNNTIIHKGVKPFVCSECGLRFTYEEGLRHHMILHRREKLFSCPKCGRAFTKKGSLSLHMRIHSGVKPFACS
ncbi:zinc finger protein 184-like [Cheilinus undulatus]|uniref:zinc finger protein 184-like n=1 Tax=Cheilinus undulatus TaxID=241271 RepID=UPI001BD1DE7F|nr:zinc finger protein 184-like [Cheilinus undulatus]